MPTAITIASGRRRQTVASASVGEISAGESGSEEGIIGEDTTPITVRTALLEWTPTPGALVTVGATTMRVVRVRNVDGDIALTLDCEGITK